MPLLTLEELQKSTPALKGEIGSLIGKKLMRWLNVDKINELYDRHYEETGPDFTSAVLEDIGVDYEILNRERLENLPEGPFIVVSNHPYGSLDGVMMVDIFGHLRTDFKIMVNGFLSRIETLDDNFIKVTPTGNKRTAPTKDSLQGIREAVKHIRDGHPLGIFPSGAVSDLSLKDKCVRDREWQESVIKLIRKLRVPIVPIHFLDRNSDFYYSLGLIDWRVRLLQLPSEVFNKKGQNVRIAIGNIIPVCLQDKFTETADFSDYLRARVYNTRE